MVEHRIRIAEAAVRFRLGPNFFAHLKGTENLHDNFYRFSAENNFELGFLMGGKFIGEAKGALHNKSRERSWSARKKREDEIDEDIPDKCTTVITNNGTLQKSAT